MLQPPSMVPIIYRPPFAFGEQPWRDLRPHGQTILEIVRSVPNLPERFIEHGCVCINGEPVPREQWRYLRPKPSSESLPITVTLHLTLQQGGGQGSSSKSIVALVAAIALVAVTAAISGGLLDVAAGGILGGVFPFAQGSIGASVLAGSVAIVGSLAIAALTKPPTTLPAAAANDTNMDNIQAAGASGNIVSKGGSVPRIVGVRKVFPPIVGPPFIEQISDQDEKVSVVYALNGPHDFADRWLDDVNVNSVPDVNVELKNGDITDTALTTITRQGRINAPNLQLSEHNLDSSSTELLNQNLTTDIPQWQRFVTAANPDEIWINLFFPGGIGNTNNPGVGTDMAVPIRMRMRVADSSNAWFNFPEFHITGQNTRQMKRTIKILWGPTWSSMTPAPPTINGFYYLHRAPPAQTNAPATPTAWVADSWFDNGSGNDYFYNGSASPRLKNCNVNTNYELWFYMTTIAKAKYEIEIMRGNCYSLSLFNKNSYIYSGVAGNIVHDFFYAITVSTRYIVPQKQAGIVSTGQLVRCQSIWNSNPVASALGKFALMAVTAINRNFQRFAIKAGGKAGQWNGTNWTTVFGATNNPSAHYRDVLLGSLNHDPLALALVDDVGLQNWYNKCQTHGTWRCDAIIDDMRTQDVLDLLASCGFARPYQSDQYGVIVDDDVSGNSPIQIFSRINSANMQFSKAFAKAPAGLIISYPDVTNNYEASQVVVLQSNPAVGTTGLYETITYDGLITASQATIRGQFDLDQANLRSTFYTFDCDMESIICRRGDLVAIQHDILEDMASDAHIKTVNTSGGNITGFVLDSIIPAGASGTTGIAIRRNDGTISTHQVASGTGTNTITLTTPFANPGTIVGYDTTGDKYGCLIVSGDLSTVYKRMLVFGIATGKDLRATVTLVDEAPALVRF